MSESLERKNTFFNELENRIEDGLWKAFVEEPIKKGIWYMLGLLTLALCYLWYSPSWLSGSIFGVIFTIFLGFIFFLVFGIRNYLRNRKVNNSNSEVIEVIESVNQTQQLEVFGEDIKLEPNIICVRPYKDYSYDVRFMAEFENRQIKSERIGTLNGVKAKIFYYNETGELIGTADEGQWGERYPFNNSVKFDRGETQRLSLGYVSSNKYYFVINSNNGHLHIPNKIKIIIHLTDDDDWANDYEFELQYNKDESSSINFIGEAML